jgi:hypothetical protein
MAATCVLHGCTGAVVALRLLVCGNFSSAHNVVKQVVAVAHTLLEGSTWPACKERLEQVRVVTARHGSVYCSTKWGVAGHGSAAYAYAYALHVLCSSVACAKYFSILNASCSNALCGL